MSGLINKIKDAVHSDKPSHGSAPEGTAGPHSSRAANAADPRVDSDLDGRGVGHGTQGTTGTHGTSGLTGTTGTRGATTTAGPHSSNIANKADPRVDSDLDGRGLGHGTTGTHGTSGLTGTTGTHGTTGYGSGPATQTAGPHSSNIANKADPRVDSDRDGRGLGHGTTGTHGTSGLTGTTGTHGTTGYGSGPATQTAGPHSSNIANKADPRVDSDRDGRGLGHGTTGTHGTSGLTGTTGTHGTHGTTGYGSGPATQTAGPHSSNIANKADPRVDSDRDGRGLGHGTTGTHTGTTGTHSGVGGTHSGTHGVGGVAGSGPGPAPNTAGPHKSDALNKIDPRVDSDLDGSKTVGGNKTYQAGATAGYYKDPTDAAQVPPSVMQKTLGASTIAHDDHDHDRLRRNSAATHQETHRGV